MNIKEFTDFIITCSDSDYRAILHALGKRAKTPMRNNNAVGDEIIVEGWAKYEGRVGEIFKITPKYVYVKIKATPQLSEASVKICYGYFRNLNVRIPVAPIVTDTPLESLEF